MKNEKAKIAQDAISTFVNSFNTDEQNREFVELMSNDHRTLQQAFTRLALAWIEKVASPAYQTDGRNETSKEICQKLLKTNDVETLYGGTPSKYIPTI